MAEVALYHVYLTRSDGAVDKVGEIAANGQRCEFRYHKGYLESSEPFPLDVINLNLRKGEYAVDRPLFGVFEDSLPDGWGRAVMSARYRLSHAEQSPHLLLRYLDDRSTGALSYNHSDNEKVRKDDESIRSIGELALAAKAFENGEAIDDMMLQRLFNSGGTPGGAHPKVNVLGNDGVPLLVKFPSVADKYDVVGLEASCLELARMVGMRVPEFSIMEEAGIKMLCLDRFDRLDGGHLHMISMQSLLNATGYYHATYIQMADVIRMVSKRPVEDLHALYRQMIFNAIVGNTDDHLKNFAMLYHNGYELTPAYDLLPNVNHKVGHTLSFLYDEIGPRRTEAVGSLAGRFKINKQSAEDIVDEVIEMIASNWNGVCKRNGVPGDETARFSNYIDTQCKKLGA